MEGIDWFNLSSEKAESILPYLLQNLHDNQFVVAAQFLLCQPHLIQYCPNRTQLLESLDRRYERNENFGKTVLKRLKLYQRGQCERDCRKQRQRRQWTIPISHTRALSDPMRNDNVSQNDGWVWNSNPLDVGTSSSLKRRYTKRSTGKEHKRAKTLFEPNIRKTHRMSGTELIVHCKYGEVLEQSLRFVWDLPEVIVNLLVDWMLDTLAYEYRNRHRKLRRVPAYVDVSSLHKSIVNRSQENSSSQNSDPLARRQVSAQHLRLPSPTEPLEDWERDMLVFLQHKPRKNTREMKLLGDLLKRDDIINPVYGNVNADLTQVETNL